MARVDERGPELRFLARGLGSLRAFTPRMRLSIEFDRETDGRWIAEVIELPGVLAYGGSRDEARAKVQALALRVIADRGWT